MNNIQTLKAWLPRVLTLAALLGPLVGLAANITWTNGAGDGLWGTPGNWSNGNVPGTADMAIFSGTSSADCLINSAVTVGGVSIQAAYGGTITQQDGHTMSIGAQGWVQAGGTFTGGNADIRLTAGTFNLGGGHFTSTSADLVVAGNYAINAQVFRHTGGTFDAHGGTVQITPRYNSWATSTFVLDVAPSTWFNNLLVGALGSSDNASLNTAPGDTVKVAGTLTHVDGRINGTFRADGDVHVLADADGGQGQLIFAGTGNQQYGAVASGRSFVWVIDKPDGWVMPTAATTHLSIQGFRQINGNFLAPAQQLRVGGTWSAGTLLFQHAGGAFNHNNGKVTLDPYYGSWAALTFTVEVLPSTWLHDLEVEAAGNSDNVTVEVAAGDTLKAARNFTQLDGFLNGRYRAEGDLRIGPGADGGRGELHLTGTGNQYYNSPMATGRTMVLVVDKPSGTVLPAFGTDQFRIQGLRLLAGHFTAPTDTLSIGGTWNGNATLLEQTGGAFAHNDGTVMFDPYYGSWQTTTFTLAPLPSLWLNHVVVKASSNSDNAIITLAAGDTLKALGHLTHADGRIMGDFLFRGDLFLGTQADGGQGQLIMDAATDQYYHAELPAARTAVLVLDKPSGAVLPAPGTDQLRIQGFRQFAGDFTAPTDTMCVGGTWNGDATIFQQTGGNFTHSNGTVMLDPYFGSYQTRTFTVAALPSLWLNHVVVKVSSSSDNAIINTAATDTLKARGHFTHADGKIMGNFLMRGDLFLRSQADGGEGHLIMDATMDQYYHTELPTGRTAVLVVAKPTGTVRPASGTDLLSIQGFRQTAGHFIAPPDTLYIGGRWGDSATILQQTGGTFAHNDGTVMLDPYFGTYQTKTFTVAPLPSLWLNQVVVKVSSSSDNAIINTAATDTLKALGHFTHADGKIMGNFLMRGDLFLKSQADGGEGHLIMDAATDQYYHVELPAARTAVLVVAKPTGTVWPAPGTVQFHIQGFRQTTGHFIAPPDTLFIGGRWSDSATILQQTGGTFAHNDGTVMLDPYFGTFQARTFTVEPHATLWLNHVVLRAWSSSDNATMNCAVGDTLKALGHLTHADGKVMGSYLTRGDLFVRHTADGGEGSLIMNSTTDQHYHVELPAARTGVLVLDKPSGAVLPAPGTNLLRIQGFRQFAGDFTAPADTLSIGGTWSTNTVLLSHQDGVFDHANGQVTLEPNPGCTARTFTLDVSSQIKFNHLLLGIASTCGTSTFLVPATGALASEGRFELARGRFNGGPAIAEGPVTVYPAFQSGTGSLVFEGSNDQAFDLTGAEAKFDGNITLNKTAGNVELLSALTMDLATQNLSLQGGRLMTTATNLLTLARNVTATPGSPASFVHGPMKKVGNNAFLFPLGKDEDTYAPLSISAPNQTGAAFTAEYFHVDPNDVGYSADHPMYIAAPLDHVDRCEYWMLDRTAGTSTVQVGLHWADHSCGVNEPNDLRVAYWNGTQWVNRGNTGYDLLPGNAGMLRSNSNLPEYGPFTLSSSSMLNPLPVELLSFMATAVGDHVELEWATASEKNSSHYIVERSRDAHEFEEVLRTPAAGNSSYILRYDEIDRQPLSGLSYYRLKQVDFDGTSETFNIVPVRFDGLNATVYPNPTDGSQIWVNLKSSDGPVIIELIDPLGRTVLDRQVEPTSQDQVIDLGQSNLAKGTYQVRLTLNGTVVTKAVVVM